MITSCVCDFPNFSHNLTLKKLKKILLLTPFLRRSTDFILSDHSQLDVLQEIELKSLHRILNFRKSADLPKVRPLFLFSNELKIVLQAVILLQNVFRMHNRILYI